ncbi:hypothetical protein IJ425_03380 [bacterium]|nr:hypothetical protein [bacterium]
MTPEQELKLEQDYLKFVDGLEKLSQKYGIAITAIGGISWDVNGFQKIEYKRDLSSGDLYPQTLVFSDGETL